jgi:hypothetical protein
LAAVSTSSTEANTAKSATPKDKEISQDARCEFSYGKPHLSSVKIKIISTSESGKGVRFFK